MDKKNRKGQAAIEFLVTYGWAILAAMLVIGAITYFGVTSPSLPDKCIFNNAFECNDYLITEASTKLRLINTFGQTIYGNPSKNITAELADSGIACTVTQAAATSVSYVDPEGIIDISCPSPAEFQQGDKARAKIIVIYTRTPDGYDQISTGEVYAAVQN